MSGLEEYDYFASLNKFIEDDNDNTNTSIKEDISDISIESPVLPKNKNTNSKKKTLRQKVLDDSPVVLIEEPSQATGKDLIVRTDEVLKISKKLLAATKKKGKRKSKAGKSTPVMDFPSTSTRSKRNVGKDLAIDLDNSVPTIDLELDDDCCVVNDNKASPNISFDSENYEISIKIKWNTEVLRFPHRKHQKFSELIEILAKNEKVPVEHIMLNVGDKIIKPDDTPDSINYKISTFITGRIMSAPTTPVVATKKKKNKNMIKLKIQSDQFKNPLVVEIGKDQTMRTLIIKCSEELKCKPENITLRFDGDLVELDDTAIDLELSGGEIFDIQYK